MTVRTPLTLTLEQESHQWCQRVSGTIIRLRHERRWSQRRLGIEVGLSQRQVAQLEANPDAQYIGRLVGTLHALGLQLLVQPIGPDVGRDRRSINGQRE
jgi:transcriptional regulator with XRE-family HTH domain